MSIKSAACAVVMCFVSSAALAQPAPLPAGPVAGLGPVMPPTEIARLLRARGFTPQATPVRNGEAYQVRAIDRFGRQVRLAIDARYGDILMVRPIVMVPPGAYGPRPYGPPRGYYDDDPPTGAVGAYPPSSGHTATLAPAHPPVPRPKPPAKPAAVTPAPATALEANPAAAVTQDSPTPANAPASAAAPASTPPTAAAAPAAMPPVAPLE